MKQKKYIITITKNDVGKSIIWRNCRVKNSWKTRFIDISDVLGTVYSFDIGKKITVEL